LSSRRRHVRERTNAELLGCIRRWYQLYGEPPGMLDWDPYRARRAGQAWRAERYYAGDWPSLKTIRNRFGRLSTAVAAAGIPVRRQGQRRAADGASLTDAQLVRIRQHARSLLATPSSSLLALHVRSVSTAHRAGDQAALHGALLDLVAVALTWAERTRPLTRAFKDA
jgi:hypothetical protein